MVITKFNIEQSYYGLSGNANFAKGCNCNMLNGVTVGGRVAPEKRKHTSPTSICRLRQNDNIEINQLNISGDRYKTGII